MIVRINCCDAAEHISEPIPDGIPDTHEEIAEARQWSIRKSITNFMGPMTKTQCDPRRTWHSPRSIPGCKQRFPCVIPVLDDDEHEAPTAALRFGVRDPWTSGHAVSVRGSARAQRVAVKRRRCSSERLLTPSGSGVSASRALSRPPVSRVRGLSHLEGPSRTAMPRRLVPHTV
jgi:hypothetical protein